MGDEMHVNLLVGVVGAVLGIFLVFQFGRRLIYDYRIIDGGIDAVLHPYDVEHNRQYDARRWRPY
jgi:hypothetical protein